MNLRKLLLATTVTLWAFVQSGTLSAQTSGVGSDGYTRVLWRATDGGVSVWKLDANLNYVTNQDYGPYQGWTPLGLTVGNNNRTYLLWRATSGETSLWWLDQNLNYGNSVIYGPYFGWLGETLSMSPLSSNDLRVLWRNTNGSVSVWIVNADLGYVTSQIYGPDFGYDPGPASAAAKGRRLKDESAVSQDSQARAAAAMNIQQPSSAAKPMPQ